MTTQRSRYSALPPFVAAGILLIPLVAHPQTTPPVSSSAPPQTATPQSQASTYLLRYKYVAGQIRNYNTTVDINGAVSTGNGSFPLVQHMQMMMSQTVQSVRADGGATIVTHIVAAQMMMNGKAIPFSDSDIQRMDSAVPTVTLSPSGKVLSVTGGTGAAGLPGTNPSSYTQFNQTALLPDNPVKIGDIWRGKVAAMGLDFFTRSVLDKVTQGADGSQVAQMTTHYYGQSAGGGMPMPNVGRLYILTSGDGVTNFNNTLGVVQSYDNSLDTKVTVEPSSTAKIGTIKTHLTIKTHMELMGNPDNKAT